MDAVQGVKQMSEMSEMDRMNQSDESSGMSESDEFKKEIAAKAGIIEKAIREYLPVKEPEGLYKATRHLLYAGGKRLRPALTLISCEAIGRDWKPILPAALAVEVIHTFTLVHDDIMDRDEMRRGVKTVHAEFGEPVAILAGDTLFAEAFEILAGCNVEAENAVKASKLLADVCVKICEGQYLDMSFEDRESVKEEEYLEMVQKKTATLLAASSTLPAVLYGEGEEVVKALWDYGINCGIAFQIQDDILDLVGKEKIGKDWGSDIVEGKKTLIMLRAMEMGVEIDIYGKGKASLEEIEKAVKRLEDCGAIEYAKSKALQFAERAKESLKVLPETHARKLMEQLADYIVTREH
jgi:geranylgeranyl diphosphate synthase type I